MPLTVRFKPAPKLQARVKAQFPASILGGTAIAVSTSGGATTISLDVASLTTVATLAAADRAHLYLPVYDSVLVTYSKRSLTTLLSGSIALRTITGTAAEITVTNGDGVSGNPTISIPAAVTLTGKTLTGGTFSTPTLTTANATGVWTASATWTLPAFTLGGTISSNGKSFSGTLADLGTVTTADINGGTVDGTIIGGSVVAAGSFAAIVGTTATLSSFADMVEIASPSNPAADHLKLFAKDVGGVTHFFSRDSAGTEVDMSAAAGAVVVTPPLAGFLSFVSTTAIKFAPFNGDRIKINGTVYAIPSAGIAGVANTSVFVNGTGASNLGASTFYYVYAFDNGGTVTADFRTDGNGHKSSTTSGNVGVEVRVSSGTTEDDTRTLIGMIRTNGSSQFVDSATQRFVRSWFNRRCVQLTNAFTAQRTTTSTSFAEINSEIRCEFLIWSFEVAFFGTTGSMFNSGGGNNTFVSIGFNGTTNESFAQSALTNAGDIAGASINVSKAGLTEGYNYATYLGSVSAGTASYGRAVAGFFNNLVGMIGP